MKHGQKPAEPRMEDVLASIRRAIDENAYGPAQGRLGGSLEQLKVKFDEPANQETRSGRSSEPAAAAASTQSQGFAGILSGRKSHGETNAPNEVFKSREAGHRQHHPVAAPNEEGQAVYEGYYGAQLDDDVDPEPEPRHASTSASPARYLPLPPPAIGTHRQSASHKEGLMSEASSEATQAAFSRLAESLTRRALGERPIADVTQELLRGMLKQWLDDNLPKIVERLVREEIERVVRRPR